MTPYDRTDGYSSQALAASKIGFTSLRSAQHPEGTCEARGAEGARATHLNGATRMKRMERYKGDPANEATWLEAVAHCGGGTCRSKVANRFRRCVGDVDATTLANTHEGTTVDFRI